MIPIDCQTRHHLAEQFFDGANSLRPRRAGRQAVGHQSFR